MLISLCTPSHNTKYLAELYESIKEQTYQDRERVILLNGDAVDEILPFDDNRVIVHRDRYTKGIGALKHKVFSLANGEILVEVDHDDILVDSCCQKLYDAFSANKDVGFVYSDNAKLGEFIPYNARHGRKASVYKWKGQDLWQMHQLPLTPMNMGYISFMPDHVRAWRANIYHELGGHNTSLEILDDQDLIQRTYLHTKFHYIPEVLYIYRLTDSNTYKQNIEKIQQGTVAMYDKRIYDIAWRRSDLNGLRKIDLCGGINKQQGWESIDIEGGDINADLEKKRPLEDNSVGVIRAHDALEHLEDKMHTMREIHRVLAPGGILLSKTPSTDGRGARQDPTHKAFWNENAFRYRIKDREQKRFIYNDDVLFREARLYTAYPSDWHKQYNISYVYAHLEKF